MTTDDDLKPGDVVVVPFPFTDPSTAKRRPALVLSSAEFNGAGPDVIICAMTSRLQQAPSSLVVTQDGMQTGRLPSPSRVKVGKLALLKKDLVLAKVGQVRPEVFRQVMREFETLFP
ncbi:MAG TPA: type II toxin-antitoxin system PemK/MazF family toxin [Candidatus Thermoplasmatota archaeon]|nr:type II toxin-antitoxin system PemK/MazF family toxin [Candidatus Thermoplasmatota archaeon]